MKIYHPKWDELIEIITYLYLNLIKWLRFFSLTSNGQFVGPNFDNVDY